VAPPAVAPSPSTFCAPTPPVLQSWDLSLLSASQLPLMLLPLSRAPPLSLSLAPPSIRDTSSTPVGRFLLPRRLPPPVDRASFSTPPTTSSTPVGDGFPRCDGIPGPRRPRPLAAEVSGIRRRRRPSSGQRGPLRRQGRSSSGRLDHRTRSVASSMSSVSQASATSSVEARQWPPRRSLIVDLGGVNLSGGGVPLPPPLLATSIATRLQRPPTVRYGAGGAGARGGETVRIAACWRHRQGEASAAAREPTTPAMQEGMRVRCWRPCCFARWNHSLSFFIRDAYAEACWSPS
jgi:hypothetical protein